MKFKLAPRGLSISGGLAAALLLACSTASASTIAHYRFEDGSAGTTAWQATDSSANGHDMAPVEEPTFSENVPVAVLPLTGESNALSADFTGGNARFAGAQDDAMSQVVFQDFTLEAWVRHESTSGPQTYIGRDDQAGQGGGVWTASGHALVYFQKGGNNQFRIEVVSNDGRLLPLDSGVGPQPNVWYHVAAVGNSQTGTLSIYVDGVLRASRDDYTALAVPELPSTPWSVGRGQWNGNPTDFMNGQLDEARISNAALSPGQFLNFDEERIEILQQPAGAIAWAGEDVAFNSHAVLVGDGELSFQWQVSTNGGTSWEGIDGATSPSYTLVSAGAAMDENLYRVEVSHGDVMVHSDEVLLRVGDATPPTPQGLVAHYRFEEGADGGIASGAQDSSGNGRDLAEAIGSPTYSSLVPSARLPQTGADNGLSSDLTDGQYAVQGTDGDSLSLVEFDDFTIEAWVNFADVGGWQTIVGRDDRGRQYDANDSLLYFQNTAISLEGFPANTLRIAYVNDAGVSTSVGSPHVFAPNTWYHVAAVGDTTAGTLSLYVNGNRVNSADGFAGLFKPANPTRWTIGRGQWGANDAVGQSQGDWVNGRIDEVRFSSVALSPVEFLSFNNAILQFHTEPADYTAAVGEAATFTSLAGGGGTGELSYQWEISEDGAENWSAISGATAATYTVESANIGDHQNQFRVIASRDGASITSDGVVLSVPDYPPPTIVQGLTQGQLAFEGDDFTFSVEATGLGNITYQWQKDGVEIGGEGKNTLALTNLTPADEGTYSVIVSDDAALADGLEPASVTLSSYLAVAPHLRGAVSLNFVGSGSANWGSTAELARIHRFEVAGAVPVANWNNSADVNWHAVQAGPFPLVSDAGAATPMTATWDANNTWSARAAAGAPSTKSPNNRLFHGFIERRAEDASENPATITVTGIPYETYDVYVYPMSVEDAPGWTVRNVRLEDESGTVRETFMRAITGNPTPEDIPFILSHAETLQEAIDGPMTSYIRFGGVSGSTVTLRHYDNNDHEKEEHNRGWNAGGFAAISIVDTTPTAPARPKLVSRPSGGVVPAGNTAALTVQAEPTNPGGSLAYQWQRNGVNLSGATSATLSIADASSADTGNYTVIVTETSDLGTSENSASAQLVVVDDTRRTLISSDMHLTAPDVEHLEMSGHGILRLDGPVTIDPNTGDSNPHEIGVGDTIWNRLALGHQGRTYLNLFDSEGLHLSGVTFAVAGATGAEDAPTGGGIDEPISDFAGPLLRDYVFTQDENTMTATLSGLQAFAGREVTLVVYAIGKSSTNWASEPSRNDVATVTLAAQNSLTGEAVSGVTNQVQGRDLRYNNEAHVIFDAVVAPNGTLAWTIGPVPGEPGLNAFNGFQLLVTDQGEPSVSPVASWRLAHFGTAENSGDAALTADPDGDGIINLLEYALGADPTVAGDAIGSVFAGEADAFLTLTFAHIDDPAVIYEIEAADSLDSGWSVVHTYPAFTGWGVQTYTDTVPASTASGRFLRLKVTISE